MNDTIEDYGDTVRECLLNYYDRDGEVNYSRVTEDAAAPDHALHSVKGIDWENDKEHAQRDRERIMRAHCQPYLVRLSVREIVEDAPTEGNIPLLCVGVVEDESGEETQKLVAVRTVDDLDRVRLHMASVIAGWTDNRDGAMTPAEIAHWKKGIRMLRRPLAEAIRPPRKKAA